MQIKRLDHVPPLCSDHFTSIHGIWMGLSVVPQRLWRIDFLPAIALPIIGTRKWKSGTRRRGSWVSIGVTELGSKSASLYGFLRTEFHYLTIRLVHPRYDLVGCPLVQRYRPRVMHTLSKIWPQVTLRQDDYVPHLLTATPASQGSRAIKCGVRTRLASRVVLCELIGEVCVDAAE